MSENIHILNVLMDPYIILISQIHSTTIELALVLAFLRRSYLHMPYGQTFKGNIQKELLCSVSSSHSFTHHNNLLIHQKSPREFISLSAQSLGGLMTSTPCRWHQLTNKYLKGEKKGPLKFLSQCVPSAVNIPWYLY